MLGASIICALVAVLDGGGHNAGVAKAASSAGAPQTLTITYPGDGASLPYVRREFVFGAASPHAVVRVNGYPALVAASGGWIAFVPVRPGRFHLAVVATEGSASTALDRVVQIATPLQTLAATPARIDASVKPAPDEGLTLDPGDVVHVRIKASAGARVSAWLTEGVGETSSAANLGSPASARAAATQLVETSIPNLNPSDKERILGDAAIGPADVGGIYTGDLRIPATASGTLSVVYAVSASDGSSAQATAEGRISVSAVGMHRVGLIVVADPRKDIDARPYGIVESEPDGGWLFFPPEHTPFEVTGSDGDYYRVALGGSQQGWIAKDSLALQPAGAPAPHASVQGVDIRNTQRTSTVIVHMSARAPFWIAESSERPGLRIRFFNAAAGTDFVRYGADRSLVSEIRWDQLPGDVATVDVALRQRTLWGYHAQWVGDDLQIAIKKPPRFARSPASALRDLLVVIDPGHSPDAGAIGPLGTQERDVNLAIAKQLERRLRAYGARTALTRRSDVPVGLYARTELAARLGADVLVSVHNNALPDGIDPWTHHGFSVYYYQPQSLALARSIHAAYSRDTALLDYGLYYDDLALARPTEEPAVLTESAFIMWPPEEMLLRDASFQATLGRTIADGLNRWAAAMRARELGG